MSPSPSARSTRISLGALAGALVAAVPQVGAAQTLVTDVPALRLPRPGYEFDGHHVGSFTVLPTLEVSTQYDSNLFATSSDPVDDIRFEFGPEITVRRDSGDDRIFLDAYGRFKVHAANPREDSQAFGASAAWVKVSSAGRRTYAALRYDRSVESRADPETRAGPTDRPRLADDYRVEGSWREPFGRMTLDLEASAEKVDLLDPAEQDRDMTSYRTSLRLGYRVSPATSLFVEGFVNRRDFRLATDFSGVDRDATTIGGFVGFRKELGQRLQGRLGVGLFHFDPDDSRALEAYTALGLTGELTWYPRVRTAVSLRASRGDMATVRNGAFGRTDTNVRLGVDQEVRHNFILHAAVIYDDRAYRGNAISHLTSVAGEVEAEYLVNRRFSIFAGAYYSKRDAPLESDRYKRAIVQIGVRTKL